MAQAMRRLIRPRPFSTSRETSDVFRAFTHLIEEGQGSAQRSFPRMLSRVEEERVLEVAMVGLPNAGKSTLMNKLVDDRISAVSPKRNTTRRSVLGVLTRGDAQVCFMDTPGYVSHRDSPNFVRPLYTAARDAMHSVDLTMVVVDAARRIDSVTRENLRALFKEALQTGSEMAIVLNKVDLVEPKDYLLDRTEELLDVLADARERLRRSGEKQKENSDDGNSEILEISDSGLEEAAAVGEPFAAAAGANVLSKSEHSSGGSSGGRSGTFGTMGDSELLLTMPEKQTRGGVSGSVTDEAAARKHGQTALSGDKKAASEVDLDATVFMISAKLDDGVDDVRNYLLLHARPGPWLMDEGVKTDMEAEDRVNEIFREQVYVHLHQEVPYRVLVRNRSISQRPHGGMVVEQDFFVGTEAHKRVLKSKLNDIIHGARPQLKEVFKRHAQVHGAVKLVKNFPLSSKHA